MSGFSRERGTREPQFVPGNDHSLLPIGSADAQVVEAMSLAKERNRTENLTPTQRIVVMEEKASVAVACDFLDAQSPYERDLYLAAERKGKNRKTVLGRYGWS